jgi:ribosomal-protein-alanine N-acetyltransferase
METHRIILRERTTRLMQKVLQMESSLQFLFFGLNDEASLQKELERIRNGQYQNYYSGTYFDLVLKENKAVIGSAGYHTWWRDHDRAELGYGLTDEKNRRNGYMNEILPFILDYGFKKMHLNRIEAKTAQENIASISLLEKYGFKKEATIHSHYKLPDGSYSDDFLFYLLNDK